MVHVTVIYYVLYNVTINGLKLEAEDLSSHGGRRLPESFYFYW